VATIARWNRFVKQSKGLPAEYRQALISVP